MSPVPNPCPVGIHATRPEALCLAQMHAAMDETSDFAAKHKSAPIAPPKPAPISDELGDPMRFANVKLGGIPVVAGYYLIAGCVIVQGIECGEEWLDIDVFAKGVGVTMRRDIERQRESLSHSETVTLGEVVWAKDEPLTFKEIIERGMFALEKKA